jgi:hypothetical protein
MNRILKGWRFMRIVRLLVGLYFCWEAIATRQWLLGLAGLLISWMALSDTGCCGAHSCRNDRTGRSPDGERSLGGHEAAKN